jgi:chromosome transmission fidelity protein 8
MTRIFLRVENDQECPEFTLLEMQGSISSTKSSIQGADLGQLQVEGNKATLKIGAQILEGSVVELSKPLMMIDQKSKPMEIVDTNSDCDRFEMGIRGIVRKKILFKNRPIPVTGDQILI